MATALEICQTVARRLRLDQPLTSFDVNADFPMNIMLDTLQDVVRDINRLKNHRHLESNVGIPLGNLLPQGVLSTYAFTPAIDTMRLKAIKLEPLGQDTITIPFISLTDFHNLYPAHSTATGRPEAYTAYNNLIAFSHVPDQDYGMVIYYHQELPLPFAEGDIVAILPHDEDLFLTGVEAKLAMRLDYSTGPSLLADYREKIEDYKSKTAKSSGRIQQMPARW